MKFYKLTWPLDNYCQHEYVICSKVKIVKTQYKQSTWDLYESPKGRCKKVHIVDATVVFSNQVHFPFYEKMKSKITVYNPPKVNRYVNVKITKMQDKKILKLLGENFIDFI